MSQGTGNKTKSEGNNSVAGDGIYVNSEGCTVSGKNISVGRGNFNITVVSCEGVIISDNVSGCSIVNSRDIFCATGVSGLSLINCSGVSVLPGVLNFSAIGLQNQVIDTSYSGNHIFIDRFNSSTKQANFTSSLDKRYYWCDASLLPAPNTLTVTLGLKDDLQPIPIQTFKRTDNTAGVTVTLSPQGGRLIDGVASYVLTSQWESRTVLWDPIVLTYYII